MITNPFGFTFDDTILRDVTIADAFAESRSGSDIFPRRAVTVPSIVEIYNYIDSEEARRTHSKHALGATRELYVNSLQQDNYGNFNGIPTEVTTVWWTALTCSDLVELTETEYSVELSFHIVMSKDAPRDYQPQLSLRNWKPDRSNDVETSPFELGLWWSYITPRGFPHGLVSLADVATFYGFAGDTTLLSANEQNLREVLPLYRKHFPPHESLIWLALALSRKRPIGQVMLPKVHNDMRHLADVTTAGTATAGLHAGMTVEKMLEFADAGLKLDEAIPYYVQGVEDIDVVRRLIDEGVDTSLVSSVLGGEHG